MAGAESVERAGAVRGLDALKSIIALTSHMLERKSSENRRQWKMAVFNTQFLYARKDRDSLNLSEAHGFKLMSNGTCKYLAKSPFSNSGNGQR